MELSGDGKVDEKGGAPAAKSIRKTKASIIEAASPPGSPPAAERRKAPPTKKVIYVYHLLSSLILSLLLRIVVTFRYDVRYCVCITGKRSEKTSKRKSPERTFERLNPRVGAGFRFSSCSTAF
eukprot:2299746-Pyramimonas_sp.AAC.1